MHRNCVEWFRIPKHTYHILIHEPRFIVYHHCHHFSEALIPIMGLISLQYTERTWNGPETDLQRIYNGITTDIEKNTQCEGVCLKKGVMVY